MPQTEEQGPGANGENGRAVSCPGQVRPTGWIQQGAIRLEDRRASYPRQSELVTRTAEQEARSKRILANLETDEIILNINHARVACAIAPFDARWSREAHVGGSQSRSDKAVDIIGCSGICRVINNLI